MHRQTLFPIASSSTGGSLSRRVYPEADWFCHTIITAKITRAASSIIVTVQLLIILDLDHPQHNIAVWKKVGLKHGTSVIVTSVTPYLAKNTNQSVNMAESSTSIELQASAYAYSGCYGPKSSTGDIVVASVKCGAGPSPSGKKEIFLVVDLSGSMSSSVPFLRASLKAFRDTLVNRSKLPDGTSDETIEELFRNSFNVTLIGYNEKAWLIYSTDESDPAETWDEAIENQIRAEGCTNMGDGVQMAFDRIRVDRFSWVMVMTDGMSNRGKYQSTDSFGGLALLSPPNTRIITLGYGSEFNASVLCALGEFTYVATREQIPSVFGSIVNEVVQAWGFGGTWNINGYPGNKKDTIYIIGKERFGVLYNEREYMVALRIPPEDFRPLTAAGTMNLEFQLISSSAPVSIPLCFKFVPEEVPLHVRNKYYAAAKGRRLEKFYQLTSNQGNINIAMVRLFCDELKAELKEWTEDCAIEHREELLRLIEKFDTATKTGGTYTTLSSAAAARATDMNRQTSNTIATEQTAAQISSIDSTARRTTTYIRGGI